MGKVRIILNSIQIRPGNILILKIDEEHELNMKWNWNEVNNIGKKTAQLGIGNSVVFYIFLQSNKMETRCESGEGKLNQKSARVEHPNPENEEEWKKNIFCAMHHNCIKRMENGMVFGEI